MWFYLYVGYSSQAPRYSHEFRIFARDEQEAQKKSEGIARNYGALDLIRTKLVKISD